MSDDANKTSHLDRRDFIKTAGAGAGLILLGDTAGAEAAPARSALVRSGASPDIVVIGAGIVGLCTGYELARTGWSVSLFDPNPPGSQCSSGNAGALSSGWVRSTTRSKVGSVSESYPKIRKVSCDQ